MDSKALCGSRSCSRTCPATVSFSLPCSLGPNLQPAPPCTFQQILARSWPHATDFGRLPAPHFKVWLLPCNICENLGRPFAPQQCFKYESVDEVRTCTGRETAPQTHPANSALNMNLWMRYGQ